MTDHRLAVFGYGFIVGGAITVAWHIYDANHRLVDHVVQLRRDVNSLMHLTNVSTTDSQGGDDENPPPVGSGSVAISLAGGPRQNISRNQKDSAKEKDPKSKSSKFDQDTDRGVCGEVDSSEGRACGGVDQSEEHTGGGEWQKGYECLKSLSSVYRHNGKSRGRRATEQPQVVVDETNNSNVTTLQSSDDEEKELTVDAEGGLSLDDTLVNDNETVKKTLFSENDTLRKTIFVEDDTSNYQTTDGRQSVKQRRSMGKHSRKGDNVIIVFV